MTGNALRIEDRLDQACETEAVVLLRIHHRLGPVEPHPVVQTRQRTLLLQCREEWVRVTAGQDRLQCLRRAPQSDRLRGVDARLMRMFVAADATVDLAGLQRGPAPHRLDAAAVLIDELEVERRARWSPKAATAIGLHVRLAEDVFHVVRAVAYGDGCADLALRGVPAVLPVPADVDGTVFEADHAYFLDAACWRARHGRALVNVLHIVGAETLRIIDVRQAPRWRHTLFDGDRLHAMLAPVEGEQFAAACLVHRVDAKARGVRPPVVAASLRHE